jgi:hypothetical protein
MDIFGLRIELLHLVQGLVAILFVGLYQVLTTLKQESIDDLSAANMALLISFVSKQMKATVDDLRHSTAYSIEKKYLNDVGMHLERLEKSSEYLLATGSTDRRNKVLKNLLVTVLLAPFVLPFITPLLPWLISDFEIRLTPTPKRQTDFAGTAATAIVVTSILFVAIISANAYPMAAIITGAVAIVVILECVFIISILIRHQLQWKAYWEERMFEIMARAEKENQHGLFLKALALRNDIASQPDVPMPGNTGFYAIVFAVSQTIVYWAFLIAG